MHALEELRELARGIHPAVLTDRGLAPAIEALVGRTPLPVEVDVCEGRLPAAVEAASYYVVAEALTNVAKYAGASSAHVHIARENGRVVIEVADDGAGGADPVAWERPTRARRPARRSRRHALDREPRGPRDRGPGRDPARRGTRKVGIAVPRYACTP